MTLSHWHSLGNNNFIHIIFLKFDTVYCFQINMYEHDNIKKLEKVALDGSVSK